MGVSFRLADAPPALVTLHREHLDRQSRAKAASAVARIPPPVPKPPASLSEPSTRDVCQPGELYGPSPLPPILTARRVKEAVSIRLGVSVADIDGRSRSPRIARARHIAMYVIHSLVEPAISFPAVGRRMRRDHSTVIHGVSKIRWLAYGPNPDPDLRADLIAIAAALGKTIVGGEG